MNPPPALQRSDFDELLAEHQRLIHLTNELEYHLYQLGEGTNPTRITECQQAAGALIGLLRRVLFRHDQQVFPVLESLLPALTRRPDPSEPRP
jgi:hemerythrin-like domain-containing protein